MSDPDANYLCTLTEASIKKAKDELHEDPDDRLGSVKALREWIDTQPHIQAPTNTLNLLRVLRNAKFSQLKAREYIENELQLEQDEPDWFKSHDPLSEKLQKFFDIGYMVPLGTNAEGELVILERLGDMDPKLIAKKADKIQFLRAINLMMHQFLFDENIQVNGIHFIADCTGMTMKHQMIWTLSDMKVFGRMFKACTPCRMKGMHMYNYNSIVDAMMALFKPLMPTKLQNRMHTHGSNLESLYKVFPMELFPPEYLPDDYTGPRNKPIPQLIEDYKKKLQSPDFIAYVQERTNAKYGIDKNKKLKEPEYQASFRKLNVD